MESLYETLVHLNLSDANKYSLPLMEFFIRHVTVVYSKDRDLTEFPAAPTMICKRKKILDFTPTDCWKLHFPKPEKYCIINKYKSKANPPPPNFYIITTRISTMKIFQKTGIREKPPREIICLLHVIL